MNPTQLSQTLHTLSTTKWCVNVQSSPSLAKSAVIQQTAKELNYHLIDFRLAQCDVSDIAGLPAFNADKTRCHFALPETFILANQELPIDRKKITELHGDVSKYSDEVLVHMLEDKNLEVNRMDGVLLVFEELSSAPALLQSAAYKIILDRMIGDQPLHPKTFICAAGNLVTDKAVANAMSTALQSRMINLTLEPNLDSWLSWANKNAVHASVKLYLSYRPANLYKFDPAKAASQTNYPCYRTWTMVSDYIHVLASQGKTVLDAPNSFEVLAGCLGKGTAVEFKAFLQIKTPSPHEIMSDPDNVDIGDSISKRYAMAGLLLSLAETAFGNTPEEEQAKTFQFVPRSWAKVVERLPDEYKMLILKSILENGLDDKRDTDIQGMLGDKIYELCADFPDDLFNMQ